MSPSAEPVWLLDGNVLIALADEAHLHHTAARTWFAAHARLFATCPITQGTLLRILLNANGKPRPITDEDVKALEDEP